MKQLMSRLKVLAFKATREGKIAASSVMDFTFWKLGLFGKGGKSVSGKKKIVFVGEFLPPRIARISKWLRKTGDFETILVCSGHGFVDKFSGNNFDAIHLFRNRYHLFMFMHQHRDAWMMHGFGPKSEYPDHARMQFSKIPFVHDMQDVLVTYYGTNPPLRWARRELPHERNCLEFAQGVVCHSLEPREGFKRFAIAKRPPTLYFPLYCDDEMFRDNTGKNLDGEIHVVYAGGVAGSHRPKAQYGNIQFAWLIETLSQQKIHFHIYPSPSNIKADYEEYEQMAKVNPYFHYHEPVAQENLSTELSKYHFGILPFFEGRSGHSTEKFKYATTLKMFNYIEGGLQVLVSPDMIYQHWILARYGFGIGITKEEFSNMREKIATIDYQKFIAETEKNRMNLSLKLNIASLIKFYDTISKHKK